MDRILHDDGAFMSTTKKRTATCDEVLKELGRDDTGSYSAHKSCSDEEHNMQIQTMAQHMVFDVHKALEEVFKQSCMLNQ